LEIKILGGKRYDMTVLRFRFFKMFFKIENYRSAALRL